MKYSEFEAIAKEYGWDFDNDEEPDGWIYVNKDGFVIAISKFIQNYMDLHTVYAGQASGIEFSEEKSFIKACYELAETPMKDREDEKEYYLRHMFLDIKNDNNYLNMHIDSEQFFLVDGQLDHRKMYKTRFTEREIEKIEDTGFDLRNFELVEVEE